MMSTTTVLTYVLCLCALIVHATSGTAPSPSPFPLKSELEFVPNKGQLRSSAALPSVVVLYVAKSDNTTCYLGRNAMYYVQQVVAPDGLLKQHRVDLVFVGSNAAPRIEELDTTDGYLNYYLDGVRVEGVRAVRRLVYHDLYPHIDLVLYSTGTSMKYDFVVHPGGDPKKIVMRYVGMDALTVMRDGRSRATTSLGTIDELRPYTYQNANHEVESGFVRRGTDISFRIGVYDRGRDLIIDPQRLWATYYGGNQDNASCVRTDADGNIIMAGWGMSSSKVSTPGAHQENAAGGFDGFIVKFNSDGTRLWATYFGGPGEDTLSGLAVGPDDEVYVTGTTTSSSGIATAGAQQTVFGGVTDLFLSSFTTDGLLRWATYFGGSNQEKTDLSHCASMTPDGKVVIVGRSDSDVGIATAGAHKAVLDNVANRDGVVAVYSTAGVLQWATYVGGTAVDHVYGVSADTLHDRIVIAGLTYSTDGISTTGAHQVGRNGPFDAFVMSFSTTGVQQWGSYIGGNNGEVLVGVDCDANGSIYATGITGSTTGLATAGAHGTARRGGTDAFLVKLSYNGVQQWCTYFGGLVFEDGFSVSVGESTVYISGNTYSTSDLATTDAYKTTLSGIEDAFLAAFTPDGALRWASYYGGIGIENGTSVHVDSKASVYLSGVTSSTDNIASTGAHQTALQSTNNAYLVKFCDAVKPVLSPNRDTSICLGSTLRLDVTPAIAGMRWYEGSTALTSLNDSTRYNAPVNLSVGVHPIWVELVGPYCTMRSDTIMVRVFSSPVVTVTNDTVVCKGSKLQLNATVVGGTVPHGIRWTPSTGLDNALIQRPIATVTDSIVYRCVVTDANGCISVDSVRISAFPPPYVNMTRSVVTCSNDSVVIGVLASFGLPPLSYAWTPTAGLSSAVVDRPTAAPATTTLYKVMITDGRGCTTQDSVEVQVRPKPLPNVTPRGRIALCGADTVVLRANQGFANYVWNVGGTGASVVARSSGTYIVTVTNAEGCKGSDTVVVVKSTLPTPVITGPDAACLNSTLFYDVSGDTANSYAWTLSGGGTLLASAQPQRATVQWTAFGTWTIAATVTNADGCKATATLQVTIADSLKPIITPAGPITLCKRGVIVLRASKGFLTYEWSNGATADSIIVTKSGVYTVTVLGQGGCGGSSDSVVVTAISAPSPQPRIIASDTVLCSVDDAVLTLAPSAFAAYQWSTGETTDSISVRSPGRYWAMVIDTNGCSGVSDTVEIRVAPQPDATISPSGPTRFCDGDSVVLTAPTGLVTYRWSTGETTQSIVVKKDGSYQVLVLSADGCDAGSTITIRVYDRPTVAVTGPDTVCHASTTTYAMPSTTGSVVWSLSAGLLGTIVSGQGTSQVEILWGSTSGSASLTAVVTTVDGCTVISNVLSIVVHPPPTPPIITRSGITLMSSVASTYQWILDGVDIPGATTQTHTPNASGVYSVRITDIIGCGATSDTISYDATPVAVIVVDVVPRVDPNSTVEVPIVLMSSTDLDLIGAQHYTGTLRYNGTMILPTGSRGGTITLPDNGVAGSSDRTVVFEGDRGSLTSGTLQWLQFATLLGNDTCTTLELSDVRFTDAVVGVTITDGIFCESGICIVDDEIRLVDGAVRLTLSPLHPNPAYEQVHISYKLNEVGWTQLLLTDVLGRTVREIVNEHQMQGDHEADVDLTTVSPGWYRIVLKTPSAQRHQHLIIGTR